MTLWSHSTLGRTDCDAEAEAPVVWWHNSDMMADLGLVVVRWQWWVMCERQWYGDNDAVADVGGYQWYGDSDGWCVSASDMVTVMVDVWAPQR